MKRFFISILCILLLAVPATAKGRPTIFPNHKNIDGIILSFGRAENGVPFYRKVGDYLLQKKVMAVESFPSASVMAKRKVPIVSDGDGFYAGGLVGGKVTVNLYESVKGKKSFDYQVVDSKVFEAGEVDGMKRLRDGRILLAWHYKSFNTAKVYSMFSFFDGRWNTFEVEWENLSMGYPWINGDFAQIANGDIWYFGHRDSNKNICMIRLHENGEVIEINPNWSTKYDGDFACEGENPFIICEPYEDGVILAYQNHNVKYFSTDPFFKGARISVIKVTDEGRELLWQTDEYAERTTPFALIGDSVITNIINEGTLKFNRMYHVTRNEKKFLCDVKYPQLFRYTDTKLFCNGLDGKIKILEIPDNRRE